MYDIKAIPTRYNSVQFRSRLEARWAAFFDLSGIKWEYEPFDLDGWAPDFLLLGNKVEILVEVKPTSDDNQNPFQKAIRYEKTQIKDEERGDTKFVMCVGRSPLIEIDHPYADVKAFGFGNDCFFSFYEADGKIDIATCWGGTWDALTRVWRSSWKETYDGYGRSAPIVAQLWREAGNIVQWKPSR